MKSTLPQLLATQCRAVPITLSLVMANVLVHGLLAAIDNRAFMSLGYERFLVQWGANVHGLTLSGEWWRLGSSVFLHAGVMHLFVNSVVLFEIGRYVEPRFGSLRMLVTYLLSGLGGSLASATWHTLAVSAGASGAIFGLIGTLVVFGFGAPGRLCNSAGQTISLKRLLTSVGLTLVLGLVLKFDNVAHGGGFVVGSILATSVLLSEKWGQASKGVFAATALGVAAVLVGGARIEYRPDLARQIRFAQLLDQLRQGSADLRMHLRRCTEDSLQGGSADYQQRALSCLNETMGDEAGSGGEHIPKLKSAYEIWIELNGRSVWPTCQKRAGQLERLAQTPTQRQGFALARDYCQARLQLEAAIFAAKPVELSVQRLGELVSRYVVVFDAIQNRSYTSPVFANEKEDEAEPLVQYPAGVAPDPDREKDDELAAAMVELARSITPEAEAYASLDDCPYMTCFRSWATRLFGGNR